MGVEDILVLFMRYREERKKNCSRLNHDDVMIMMITEEKSTYNDNKHHNN